ncbi:hypothetical protein SKAU_G00159110 [Synaphobranchus kaupii]|uniref:HAT C-terminal dimerisation domain-containing protein n=1 Tax=Synaphobranchus kaupii TaxID=118154 RepID=A0A9Q1IYP9_SYNKA|nr:hypothetical protein SKAU_G00159110 [Synaphobranchus kaupii]
MKEYDELHHLYPNLSQLSAIALTVPVSSVNCERDFSIKNRMKTDVRNRLQQRNLTACMWIRINGPPVSETGPWKNMDMTTPCHAPHTLKGSARVRAHPSEGL